MAAVVAMPAALLVWVALTVVLTLVFTDFVLAGALALGAVAAVGFLLLMAGGTRRRGVGIGSIITLVPCALVLALSLA